MALKTNEGADQRAAIDFMDDRFEKEDALPPIARSAADALQSRVAPADAFSDALHYAIQYAQDGPIELYKVTREKVNLAKARAVSGAIRKALCKCGALVDEKDVDEHCTGHG